MADKKPCDYVSPVLIIHLKRHQLDFRREWDPKIERCGNFDYTNVLRDVCGRLKFLRNCSLQCNKLLHRGRFGEGEALDHSPLRGVLLDFEVVLGELKEVENAYELLKRDEFLEVQLSEAKKSTKTAVSVARLTKLVFIFIPLNFITSFFGMNVRAFGNGNVELWIVITSAVVLTCLTFCPFIGRFISLDITASVIKLFLISPRIGFWLCGFVLLHFSKTNADFCSQKIFHFVSKGVRGRILRSRCDEAFWKSHLG